MIVYLTMLAISLFFANFARNTRPYPALKKDYAGLGVCSAVPFIVVSVFRYEVGIDWNVVYAPYFYYIKHGIAQFSEDGFNLIYRTLYHFTDDPWYLFAVVGLLTNVLFFAAIYKQSDDVFLSVLLYFTMSYYFQSLNQIRQMLAMAIFVYALRYVRERKFIRYCLLILLACTIHRSSVIYFPIYFLYGWKSTVKRSLLLMGASIVGLPVLQKIIIPIILHTKYGWYLDSAFSEAGFYKLGFLAMFGYLMLHLLHLWRMEHDGEEDKEFWFMNNMVLLATITLLFSAVISQVARVADGLGVILIFSIPRIIHTEKHKRVWLLCVLGFIVICLCKFSYDTFINAWHGVLPYQTVFQR